VECASIHLARRTAQTQVVGGKVCSETEKVRGGQNYPQS
jgi:hypothetical protein